MQCLGKSLWRLLLDFLDAALKPGSADKHWQASEERLGTYVARFGLYVCLHRESIGKPALSYFKILVADLRVP